MAVNNMDEINKRLEELERARMKPPKATEAELREDEETYQPQPPLRSGGGGGMNMPSLGGGGVGKIFVVSLVVSLVVVFVLMMMMNVGKFVTKPEFDKNWGGMVASIDQAKATITQSRDTLDRAVANIPTTINTAMGATTNQLNQQITNVSNQVNNINSTLQGYTSKISDLTSKVDTANSNVNAANQKIADIKTSTDKSSVSIETLNTKVVALEARIKAFETPTPSTSGGSSVSIPGVTISVSVTDEGTLQASDNSTLGEIKLTLTNSGTKDIEDITVSLFVYFDDCGYSNQTITSASYGSWSIRERQVDEIELRGRLTSLNAGYSRRIYIDIKSYSNSYQLGNRITYMDTSTSDLEIIDWNYN